MTPMELRNEGVWQATLPAEDRRQLEADDGLPNGPVDVLVVGGGIIGLAVAHQLSLKKQRVQVIERGLPGDGAPGAGAGGIWPSDQGPQHPAGFAPLALASRDLWGRLSLQPDFAIEWRVNGFLTVNSNRFGGDAPSYATAAQEAGYTVHAVDGDQIAQLEPNLKPGWAAGVHCASDAHLNPLRGAASLLRAGRKRGVRLATRTELTELRQAGGRVTTVLTTRGEVSAGNVVVCTGAGITLLSGQVRPVSGQLIATAPQPPLLKGTVGGDFLTLQLKTGEIVTGGTLREGSDTRPDGELSERLQAAAWDLIPKLKGVPFERAWCGVRSATADGLPVVDRVPGCENLWVATGHHRNGVLLAPITGLLLAQWLTEGGVADELAPLRADRWNPGT